MNTKKYKKWIYHLVVNLIWSANESYLHKVIKSLLLSIKVPLKLLPEKLWKLKPQDFHIDEKLEIEGKYLEAIFQTSLLTDYA